MSGVQPMALAGALALFVPSALAAGAPPFGCFARIYDAQHLAAHPGQAVTRITVSLKPLADAAPYIASAELATSVRGHKAKVYAGGDCLKADNGLNCAMDEDAGSFTLSAAADGLRLTVTNDVRLHRLDQGSEESNGPYLRPGNPEERVFLLTPASVGACR